jgi:alpha-mannosidase
MVERIHVVFKTHFDAGFTGLAADVMRRYRTDLLEGVLEACEATAHAPEGERYTWTMPAWPLAKTLEGCSPELKRRAETVIRAGQLVWYATPFTTHTEFCGLEEWIRGLFHSRRLSEEYGYWPEAAKMTDVPGHTWITPSLLRKAGVRVLHLGCNPASTPPDVPPVFYWEGPDGEQLLTIYARDDYGSEVLPPEDWEHPIWLAMLVTGENTGSRGAAVVEEIREETRAAGLEAELRFGTLEDFAADLLAGEPELPVVRGDLADSWIHGVGSAPAEVARARSLRSRISSLEGYATWSEALGDERFDYPAVEAALEAAYESTLLFGEHTWGMDSKTFLFPRSYERDAFLAEKPSERVRLTERSWAEQREYLERAESELSVAGKLGRPAGSAPLQYGTLRLYNGLGWRRDTEILLSSEQRPAAGMVWFDAALGEVVRQHETAGGLQVKVRELPPLGARTLVQRPAAGTGPQEPPVRVVEDREALTLENAHVRLVVDRTTGWLASLVDRRSGREWVSPEHRGRFGRYVYDVYSNDDILRYRGKYNRGNAQWSIDDFGKTGYPDTQRRETFASHLDSVEVERGPDRVAVVCRGNNPGVSVERYGNPPRIEWRYTLRAGSAGLDLEYFLPDKPETPLAESGHAVFPLKAEVPDFRINKLGCVLDPLEDIVVSSGTLLHCCESWVDVHDSGAGMAVIALDSPLFSIGRNAMWDFEVAYRPEDPTLHFNLYNNWWGTNFPQWIGGELRYRFRLLPHAGDWRSGEVWKAAAEAMEPPQVFGGEFPEAGEFPPLVRNDLEGMSVVAFKRAEDKSGYVLRLRDLLGLSRAVPVELDARVTGVEAVDLLEREGRELPREDGNSRRILLETRPFEVHTLRLRLDTEGA